MKYARIEDGRIMEFFEPPEGFAITDCFVPALVWVDVTSVTPSPACNWHAVSTSGVWTFTP